MTRRRQGARPGGASAPAGSPPRFVVVTGLSGSGKTQAIRALEDLGYFCVDNLPTPLIPTLAQLALRAGDGIGRTAVVVDVRERTLLTKFPAVYRRLCRMPRLAPKLVFLEASEQVLIRRFSETRRPHPLAASRSAAEGIREERGLMKPIRRLADQVIDTTNMSVHDLRAEFMRLFSGRARGTPLTATLFSFGYKHGLPLDADLVLDVRFLPNPHFVPRLRPRTGRDRQVRGFVEKFPEAQEFLTRTTELLRFLLPQYIAEGKTYLTVAIGCTGGRHRSVAVAEALRERLGRVQGVRLRVKHRDMEAE